MKDFKYIFTFLLIVSFNVYSQNISIDIESNPELRNYEYIFKKPNLAFALYSNLVSRNDFSFKIVSEDIVEINFSNKNIPLMKLQYIKYLNDKFSYKLTIMPKRIDILSFDIYFDIKLNKRNINFLINYPDIPIITENVVEKSKLILGNYASLNNQKKIIDYLEKNNINLSNDHLILYDLINNLDSLRNNSDINKKIQNNNTNVLVTLGLFAFIFLNFIFIFIFSRRSFN